MKKYAPLFLLLVLFSCSKGPSPESLEIEKATLKCWNENWVQTKGYDISQGITLLDDYLSRKGYLGQRTVADYKKFSDDTTVIYIPDSVKGSAEMNMALNSDYAGAPNIEGMVKCWETNWFKKTSTLDTADVMYRTGKLVEAISKAGNPDFHSILDRFFQGMTPEEMERPLIKDITYFIFWKTRTGKTHIQFTHPDGPVDPNGPPPPPPLPPPPRVSK
jgi:hypothetical protein